VSFDANEEQEENAAATEVYDIEKIMALSNLTPKVLVNDVEGSEKIILDSKPNYPDSIRIVLMKMHMHMYGETVRKQIIQRIVDEGFVVKYEDMDVYLFVRAYLILYLRKATPNF